MIKEMARKKTVVGLDFKAKPEAGVVRVPCTLGKPNRLNLRGRSIKSLTPGEVFLHRCLRSVTGQEYWRKQLLCYFHRRYVIIQDRQNC